MPRLEIRENEIEDIFAQHPVQMRKLLGLSQDVFLIARQKTLPSGRLDLLYSHLSELLLIELKVEPFRHSFVSQVLAYRNDLVSLQQNGTFISGHVQPFLLCPVLTNTDVNSAFALGVTAVKYDPREVLVEFFESAPLDVKYLSVRPADKGVWRIGILNDTVRLVESLRTSLRIAKEKRQSTKTIGNQLGLAEELGLVSREGSEARLTTDGQQFVAESDPQDPPDFLSQNQARILRKFILSNPFFSGTTFGILTMVSSVFELSKNIYPVPMKLLAPHFIGAAGVTYRWDSEKSYDMVSRCIQTTIDLGLVGKIGNYYFVTPSGLSFVLLLNMHRSLKLIENSTTIE